MKAYMCLLIAVACIASSWGQTGDGLAAKKRAGFLYVGPCDVEGFTKPFEEARRAIQEKYGDSLDTICVENVPEFDAERHIVRLIEDNKCSIIFSCNFGFSPAINALSKRYPNVLFEQYADDEQDANLATFSADLAPTYYLNGIMAGALSKTGKIAYIAAFPTLEVIKYINAFALGVAVANRNATVTVRWLQTWYDPSKAKAYCQELVDSGHDAFAFTEDSPAIVEQCQSATASGKQIYSFSAYYPMLHYGNDTVVSGSVVDYRPIFDYLAKKVIDGTWSSESLDWSVDKNVAVLGDSPQTLINPRFAKALKAIPISVAGTKTDNAYDFVLKRYAQMRRGAFPVFVGPIKSQDGREQYGAGTAVPASELKSMDWFVENVIGELPR